MKRVLSVLVTVCLVGGVLLVNLETASSQAPGNTITFFDPNATDFEKDINEGRKGFSAGDWSVIKDTMFDPETCDKAGTFLARFTFIKSAGRDNGFFTFDGGVILPDGKLTMYWPGKFSEFEDPGAAGGGAITGGTGAYSGVGGDFTVEEDVQMCEKNGALITIDLAQ